MEMPPLNETMKGNKSCVTIGQDNITVLEPKGKEMGGARNFCTVTGVNPNLLVTFDVYKHQTESFQFLTFLSVKKTSQ